MRDILRNENKMEIENYWQINIKPVTTSQRAIEAIDKYEYLENTDANVYKKN